MSSQDNKEKGILIKNISGRMIGGRKVTLSNLPVIEHAFTQGSIKIKMDPNGEHYTEQMYVQSIELCEPKMPYPVMLWHGGGMTGQVWETKPNGTPGYQMFFLKNGYDVYITDSVERGRSSFSKYPEVYKSEPIFRSHDQAWEMFRIGPSFKNREYYSGIKFPIKFYDDFCKSMVPRWLDSDEKIQGGYNNLLEEILPCVLIAHSQAATFAFTAANNYPDKIKGLVTIEPGTPPKLNYRSEKIKNIPHLFLWGDNIEKSDYWIKKKKIMKDYHQELLDFGVDSTWIELPEEGIYGNSHLLMLDENSDVIAGKIHNWIQSKIC